MDMIEEARPLTSAMDNVLAWRLGKAVNATMAETAGDYIDRGLALRHHLEKVGFAIVRLPDPEGKWTVL